MSPGFISPPRPNLNLKVNKPLLPKWKLPESDLPHEKYHRLSAPDFDIKPKQFLGINMMMKI